MNAPIYVLGFLMRHGPLHGYKLKQLIAERAADFAHIKLPTIYYHLEKLQQKGFVSSEVEKAGRRPDRFVYTITENGKAHFKNLLQKALKAPFEIEFNLDAGLFFSEIFEPEELRSALKAHASYLAAVVQHIRNHRKDVLVQVPPDIRRMVRAIFNHHLVHFEAELKWVRATLKDWQP